MKTLPYGEGALFVDLEIDDAPDRSRRTQLVARALRRRLAGTEIVVGAGNLAILGVGAWDDLEGVIAESMRVDTADDFTPKHHVLRTIYDGADLDDLARRTSLSRAEVIAVHASRVYDVELIGFLPGFAYLSPLDPRLVVARRPVPRPRVPARSVAIAGPYAGVYPYASPGGWHLLGRLVDVDLFDPLRRPPALFEPGDTVRFVPYQPD
jgi:KipI family sensor histidine kinase inhibitor